LTNFKEFRIISNLNDLIKCNKKKDSIKLLSFLNSFVWIE